MKKKFISTKQNLDLNLYVLEQTLYTFDYMNLSQDIKDKIKELKDYVYKKLYIDLQPYDIEKEVATLTTYYVVPKD